MSFMGKRINLFLLLMILLLLIGFGAVTVYYQYTYKELNSQHNTLTSNYGVCSQNLTHTSNELEKATNRLSSTELDIRKYDQLYEDKIEDLEQKKGDLEQTQSQLASCNVLKTAYKKDYDNLNQQKIEMENNLTQEIKDLEKSIDDYQDVVNCLKNTNDGNEGDCVN